MTGAERLQEREEMAKTDLVGTLFNSDIPSLLGYDKPENQPERMVAKDSEISGVLDALGLSFKDKDKILCLIAEYGIEVREFGFRQGMHIGMRLCMENLTGNRV